jgi:hypothetical protein
MIRAAIVGIGWWGRMLVNAVQGKSAAIRFTAGYTRTRATAEGFCAEHSIALANDLDALLADPAVDAIVFATPHSQHGPQVRISASFFLNLIKRQGFFRRRRCGGGGPHGGGAPHFAMGGTASRRRALTEPRCASERGLAMGGGRPAERRFTVGGSGKSVARCHRTVLAYWKFESISLQRRVTQTSADRRGIG